MRLILTRRLNAWFFAAADRIAAEKIATANSNACKGCILNYRSAFASTPAWWRGDLKVRPDDQRAGVREKMRRQF